MKKIFDIKSLIVGAFLGGAVIMTIGASSAERATAWEYKHTARASEAEINQMAEQGWTVVGFSVCSTPSEVSTHYLLKRAKP
jgi:hypothetical protein